MRYTSAYLDWYVRPIDLKYDFRSSGIAYFNYDVKLKNANLSTNYAHGNPEISNAIAKRYNVRTENVFISSEGASGQNARIIRLIAEKNPEKDEAIIEYPTYEPLLRLVQEYFPNVKRIERCEEDGYRADAEKLERTVSQRTGLIVITNPHSPSGALSTTKELEKIMRIAREKKLYVLCDEIYAEFDREKVPSVFSIESDWGITTSSFTKAYGLGGLKLGVGLAKKELVDQCYLDVLNTAGNSPNIVQMIAADLIIRGKQSLEKHKQKWDRLKKETETWLIEQGLEYFPSELGVTYWLKTNLEDSYKWVEEVAIPRYRVAPVPGAFFLFKTDYTFIRSNMIRLGLGNIEPQTSNLAEALDTLKKALTRKSA